MHSKYTLILDLFFWSHFFIFFPACTFFGSLPSTKTTLPEISCKQLFKKDSLAQVFS